MDGAGFSEDGERVPTVEFDFDQVDRVIFGRQQEIAPADMKIALKLFDAVMRWIWQGGMKDVRGMTIRAIISCWIFIPELRPTTLTDMARGFGLKKQSLGRWHDDFKRHFPSIKTPHMRRSA